MDEERIRALVACNTTLGRMAELLEVDVSTVRRWLELLGLETVRMTDRRAFDEARRHGLRVIEHECVRHGLTRFQRDLRGTYRCLRCRAERVGARRRRIKEILAAEAGGRCAICGYDRCLRALGFHHVDPRDKAFGVAHRGATRSLARARAEAAKCVLLCSNCHMEVEHGLASIPLGGSGHGG